MANLVLKSYPSRKEVFSSWQLKLKKEGGEGWRRRDNPLRITVPEQKALHRFLSGLCMGLYLITVMYYLV